MKYKITISLMEKHNNIKSRQMTHSLSSVATDKSKA